MRYYRTISDDGIVSVSTLHADGDGNITEQEYEAIREMLINAPEGQVLVEDGDGYAYADAPSTEDADISPDEALDILMGVSE